MTKTQSGYAQSIHGFVDYIKENRIPIKPEILAAEFSKFFKDQIPTASHSVDSFCKSIGIQNIQRRQFPPAMKGFHLISPDNEINIVFDQRDGGTVHTLYHELYEIICE